MRTMKQVVTFIKRETVLSIAMLLAVISAFFVTPDARYIHYIDFRTLSILFCLMAVMVGYTQIGVFERLAKTLLTKVKSMRGITCILVFLCFVLSMFITNDVALITFVPLTLIVLKLLGQAYQKKWMILIVVMQTIAANMGSMLTPIGNPQNLYLYGLSKTAVGTFVTWMLPYSMISAFCLLVWIFARCKANEKIEIVFEEETQTIDIKRFVLYSFLFILCLLTVAHFISYQKTLIVVVIAVTIANRKILKEVDYSLLLTFIGFFVFIGNMGRVTFFHDFLQSVVEGREIMTGIISSQVMSNVPAALLLSGFTNHYHELTIGVNLGGLGTLIASMASLISFKYVAREDKQARGKYLLYFTLASLVFLAVEVMAVWILEMR